MKTEKRRTKRIYQMADGTYLPDSSQPDPDDDFEIMPSHYKPHQSMRYINVSIGTNGKAQIKDKTGHLRNCNKDLPEIYKNRDDCCGCSACDSICPVTAISMRPDEEGFLYPVIDAEKCSRCYHCLSVCSCELP